MSSLALDLLNKLEHDPQLNFKKSKGKYLSEGTCPDCGKPEVFVSKSNPWVVRCNRANNCSYSESSRERYPELFENFSERFPVTQEDPDAPARAYLTYDRGFRAEKVSGWYKKGLRTLFNAKGQRTAEVITVRFPLWGEHYWERLIDRSAVERNDGKKAHISHGCKFKDKGWTPADQDIAKGDWVFITEGIFKSIALVHLDPSDLNWPLKTIAAISSSNLPREFIQLHKGKDITWVLAYDNDPAGIKAMQKYQAEIEDMGEKVRIALGKPHRDWDDEWRAGHLNQRFLDDAFWQGAITFAKRPSDAAFWYHARYPRMRYYRFAHHKALYRAKLSEQGEELLKDIAATDLDKCWARESDTVQLRRDLTHGFDLSRISNCDPNFLYIQKDRFTKEQNYFFRVRFLSGNPDATIALDGSALESPAAFNKVLLKQTPGGTFDGNASDLKYLREQWFDQKATEVQTLPFAGYDKDSGAYVFPDFGYYKGRFIKPNDQGFLEVGKHRLKTYQQAKMTQASGNLDWGRLYLTAFQLDGMALMSWWLGTLFAEQIRAKYQSWTFFELTGEWGSGKSTMLEFMWRSMGMDQEEGFDPQKGSPAARARRLVQFSNLPAVLIEGDREGEDKNRQGKFHFDELKTAYNGRSMRSLGVATQDANTNEMPFRGGICISQNATVQGSDALLGRLVHCHATRNHHSEETRQALRQLLSLSTEQLATFLDKSLRMEKALLEAFAQSFDRLLQRYKEEAPALSERVLKNHAQIAAWGTTLPLLFGRDQISSEWVQAFEAFILKRALDRQTRLNGDHPLVETFWEVYHTENNKPNYGQPAFFNHSTNANRIAINLVDYEQKCRERLLPLLDRQELKRLLPTSKRYRFIGTRNVRSQLCENNETRYCWLFEVPNQQVDRGVGEDRTNRTSV